MSKVAVGILAFVFLLVAAGCGSDSDKQPTSVTSPSTPTIESIDGQEFGVIRGALTVKTGVISGTGALIFREPLTRKDNNFALRFQLPVDGSVLLSPNSEVGLQGKIAISFSRSNKDKLIVTLMDGESTNELQGEMPNPELLSAQGEIFVEVDVHDHGHITLWISGQEESFGFNARGLGKYWGLALNNATVTSAKILPPKDAH